MIHHTPLETPIAGPSGNPGAAGFTSFGCPVFSAGKAQVTETIPVEAQSAVLKWIQQVALHGEAYKNEVVEIFGEDDSGPAADGGSWWGAPQADGNNDGELEGQATDTKAANGKAKGNSSEAQTIDENGKANGNGKAHENGKANENSKAKESTPDKKNTAQAEGTGTRAVDGKASDNGGESQATEENSKTKATTPTKKDTAKAKSTSNKATGSNTKTDNKVVPAKGNGVAEASGVKTHSENTPFHPANEGPNAEDMKELVTEMKDLTTTH